MIDFTVLKSTLVRPRIFLSLLAALLIVVIWAFAFFLPEGAKISTLKTQETALEQKVQQGDSTVARLKHTYQHSAQLKSMQASLNSAVPSEADAYNYVHALSAAATAAGVHLTSISITSTPTSASQGSSSSGASVDQMPVTVNAKGTYDQYLSLISGIYKLPRLTDIDEVNISGGGREH